MKRKDVIEKMQREDPEEHIAVSTWCADDVLKQADQDEVEITEEEANYLIDEIHIGCAGGAIDWTAISASIKAHIDSLEPDCYACHSGRVYKALEDDVYNEIVVCGGYIKTASSIPDTCADYKRKIRRDKP